MFCVKVRSFIANRLKANQFDKTLLADSYNMFYNSTVPAQGQVLTVF